MAANKSIDRHAIVGGSADRTAIVGEATKLMFESDTLEDPRSRKRTVPFEVICPGMPRTGTSCKSSTHSWIVGSQGSQQRLAPDPTRKAVVSNTG